MEPIAQINADGIDGPALVAELTERILARNGPDVLTIRPVNQMNLERMLIELQDYIDRVQVTIDVRDQKLPVANALWNRIKYQFHELVYIYLSDLNGRQYAVNQQVAATLEALLQQMQSDRAERDARIRDLEGQVNQLRKQLTLQAGK